MGFDPRTNSAQLAALVARCDYKQFALTSVPTKLSNAGHPYQGEFPGPAVSPTAVGWTAVYRGRILNGSQQPPLIASASVAGSFGEAAVLTAAKDFLDGLDLMAASQGANPNPYDPRLGGGQAG
jgi:hypothetical protein